MSKISETLALVFLMWGFLQSHAKDIDMDNLVKIINKQDFVDPQMSVSTVVDIMQRIYDVGQTAENTDVSEKNDLATAAQPQVQTSSGLLKGSTNEHANSFFSIPFAVPPLSEKRFKDPEMLNTPDVERNVSAWVSTYCSKPPGSFNEDCLVLTIHTPSSVNLKNSSAPPEDRLPVFLFFHGGAFFSGSATYTVYDGRYLSEITSSIVVTANYRLGPLGFLVFDDGTNIIEGNQGLKDQRLAMQWVRDNIAKFGGNPHQVTIFGESAGAQSVMFHLISKDSDPLFERGIMESNPAVYWYPNRTEALAITDELVQSMRCGPLNNADCCGIRDSSYDCLMQSSSQSLISGMLKMMLRRWSRLHVLSAVEPFRPFIDGTEFEDQPMNLFRDGKWSTSKSVIFGSNEEELVVLKYILPINENIFEGLNQLLFRDAGYQNNTGELISQKYKDLYSSEFSDYSHIFGIEMTDIFFTCPSRAMSRYIADTTSNGIYSYIFGHTLGSEDCERFLPKFCDHAYHGSELSFVFRTIDHVGLTSNDNDTLVANQFSTYWGNFAWNDSPSNDQGFGLEGNFPDWIRYSQASREQSWSNLRIANPDAYIERNYKGEICDFWDSLGVYESPEVDAPVDTITDHPYSTTSKGFAILANIKLLYLYTSCVTYAAVFFE